MPSGLRPDPVRARHVLAIAAVVIVAGQLATGLALDASPPNVRFFEAGQVLGRAHDVGNAPYVLLLGSSRFWRLDVDAMTEALRTSVGDRHPPIVKGAARAGDAVVADYLLEKLVDQGKRPGLVVMEVSPETLARPAPWVAEHAIRFFTWRDVVAWAPEILTGDRTSRVAAARFAPVQTYRRELLTWMVGSAPPYLHVPRHWNPKAADAAAKRVAASEEEQPDAPLELPAPNAPDALPSGPTAFTLWGLPQTRKWLRRYHPNGGEARALEHVLARCQEMGTRVVLVGIPVTSWVRELYTPEIERAFRDLVEPLCRRYGAEFLDYRARVADEFFKDHHHLSFRGGVFFSRMLGSEVLAPRVQQLRRVPRRTPSPPEPLEPLDVK